MFTNSITSYWKPISVTKKQSFIQYMKHFVENGNGLCVFSGTPGSVLMTREKWISESLLNSVARIANFEWNSTLQFVESKARFFPECLSVTHRIWSESVDHDDVMYNNLDPFHNTSACQRFTFASELNGKKKYWHESDATANTWLQLKPVMVNIALKTVKMSIDYLKIKNSNAQKKL